MKRPTIPNRIPRSTAVGEKASFTRTLTDGDISLFIGATWDMNPLHTDDTYAAGTPFKKRIAPGLLTASMLTHLGGLWAFLANEMHFYFIAPVYVGDTITASAEVAESDPARGWVKLRCQCVNQHGDVVLKADVVGYPGKFEE